MYKLIFEKRALYDLDKLEAKVRERIWRKLWGCKKDPFRFFEKLVESDGFKLRVGDWRVIADILRGKQVIVVLKIGHRRNVYGR